jgi:putative endonuclease
VAFVYILRCGDGTLYTGIAKDLESRLRMHREGRASRYTRSRLPVTLLWWCERATWGDALREEHRIKRSAPPEGSAGGGPRTRRLLCAPEVNPARAEAFRPARAPPQTPKCYARRR